LFIRLGGESFLENRLSDWDDDDVINGDDEEGEAGAGQPNSRQNARARKQEHLVETRVLSIAQDLVYSVMSKMNGLHNQSKTANRL